MEWNPVSNPPTEEGEYLCRMLNSNNGAKWYQTARFHGGQWMSSKARCIIFWCEITDPEA